MDFDFTELYKDEPRYIQLEGGGIYDRTVGHIVANKGGRFTITKETAHTMHQRRKEIGLLAQMRGLAASQGLELPPDAELEKIVEGAGSAVEALTRHMAETFMGSKNLRGMGETYGKLTAGFVLDPQALEAEEHKQDFLLNAVTSLIQALKDSIAEKTPAIEGKVIEE